MAKTNYRWEARSIDGFLAQLIRYVASGHYFYVTGRIPDRKDVAAVDRKLIALYGIAKPRWARARRRLAGTAGIHYLRHNRFFLLIATHGKHALFTDHATTIRDIRRQALHVGGYAIRYTYSEREKRWKVFVRLDRETYGNLRAHMLVQAIRTSHRSPEALEREFRQLRWQPYEPVRRQLAAILKAVNRRRRYAGYPPVSPSAIPTMRRISSVFVDPCNVSSDAAGIPETVGTMDAVGKHRSRDNCPISPRPSWERAG